jgi:Gluconate 2-dehydrogenase subunit 3
MPSRRDVLAGAAALPILAQAQTPVAYKPRVFSAAELTLVRGLADTIIPRTETPGAADAQVQLHIDRSLSTRPPAELTAFRTGLAAVATAVEQGKSHTEILTSLSAAKDPFFKQLKDLTIDGYYSSKEGLAQELGWHGQVALAEFKGCTHKEHQG